MPRTIDTITTSLLPEEAYCLGGILSCCTIINERTGKTAWLLQVIHNPSVITSQELKSQKRYVNHIVSFLCGREIRKTQKNYSEFLPKNKKGFVYAFPSSSYTDESKLLTFINNQLKNVSFETKAFFLAGVFDGRSSWDKHSRKIVLDCITNDSADLIKHILDDIGIKYDYNTARDRPSGGTPRKPQVRILAPDIPLFMKVVGFISPHRLKAVTDMSMCSFLTHTNCGIQGLTRIEGLRLTKTKRNFHFIDSSKANQEMEADDKLCTTIKSKRINVPAKTPSRSGKPKAKSNKISVSSSMIIARDVKAAMNALAIAKYKCEYKNDHQTFIRKRDGLPYTEPHHLVPLAYSDDFDVSLDVEENIVSLCSNCHNQLHYGKDFKEILESLYKERKDMLATVGIFITYDELVGMYKNAK